MMVGFLIERQTVIGRPTSPYYYITGVFLLLRWKTGSPRTRSWGTCWDSMELWDHQAQTPSEKPVANWYSKTTSHGPKENLKHFEILYLSSSVHVIEETIEYFSLVFKPSVFAKWQTQILFLKSFTKWKSFAWWLQLNHNNMIELKRE